MDSTTSLDRLRREFYRTRVTHKVSVDALDLEELLESYDTLVDKLAKDAKAHGKELAVWAENYAAIERKLTEVEQVAPADPLADERVRKLVEAANMLAICAQTTGGTAGPDKELMQTIQDYAAALAAIKAQP